MTLLLLLSHLSEPPNHLNRCIKIWNLDHIFEKEQHIDKHNLTIESIRFDTLPSVPTTLPSMSTTKKIAVVVTR